MSVPQRDYPMTKAEPQLARSAGAFRADARVVVGCRRDADAAGNLGYAGQIIASNAVPAGGGFLRFFTVTCGVIAVLTSASLVQGCGLLREAKRHQSTLYLSSVSRLSSMPRPGESDSEIKPSTTGRS